MAWICAFCGTELGDERQPHCGEAHCAVEVEEQAEAEQTLQQQQMAAEESP